MAEKLEPGAMQDYLWYCY